MHQSFKKVGKVTGSFSGAETWGWSFVSGAKGLVLECC